METKGLREERVKVRRSGRSAFYLDCDVAIGRERWEVAQVDSGNVW